MGVIYKYTNLVNGKEYVAKPHLKYPNDTENTGALRKVERLGTI